MKTVLEEQKMLSLATAGLGICLKTICSIGSLIIGVG